MVKIARRMLWSFVPLLVSMAGSAQDKYSGPKPPSKDVPYIVHGDKLIATEVQKATESSSKEGQAFFVPGATSPTRTPLAQPIFLFTPDHFKAEQLGLFRFQVRNGRREVVISGKHRKQANNEVFHLSVRGVDEGISRIEVAESLEPGEYSLSPEGDNTAFCFTVY